MVDTWLSLDITPNQLGTLVRIVVIHISVSEDKTEAHTVASPISVSNETKHVFHTCSEGMGIH